jgi:hypothetical protein
MLSINKIYHRYSICDNIPSANTNTEQFIMIRENSSNKLTPCAFCQICNRYTISTSTTTVSSTATVCHGTNDHNYLCKTGNLRKNSETKKFINDVNRVNHHEEKKKERTIRSLQSIASSSSNYKFAQLTRLKRVQITSGPPRKEKWIPNKNPPPVERHPVVPPRSAQAPDVDHHATIIEDVITKEAPTELGGEDAAAVPQAALEEAPTEPVMEPVVNDPPPLLEDDVIAPVEDALPPAVVNNDPAAPPAAVAVAVDNDPAAGGDPVVPPVICRECYCPNTATSTHCQICMHSLPPVLREEAPTELIVPVNDPPPLLAEDDLSLDPIGSSGSLLGSVDSIELGREDGLSVGGALGFEEGSLEDGSASTSTSSEVVSISASTLARWVRWVSIWAPNPSWDNLCIAGNEYADTALFKRRRLA